MSLFCMPLQMVLVPGRGGGPGASVAGHSDAATRGHHQRYPCSQDLQARTTAGWVCAYPLSIACIVLTMPSLAPSNHFWIWPLARYMQSFSFHLFAKRPIEPIVSTRALRRDIMRRMALSALQVLHASLLPVSVVAIWFYLCWCAWVIIIAAQIVPDPFCFFWNSRLLPIYMLRIFGYFLRSLLRFL